MVLTFSKVLAGYFVADPSISVCLMFSYYIWIIYFKNYFSQEYHRWEVIYSVHHKQETCEVSLPNYW